MIAVILAAGVGKRLFPITKEKPKSLIPFGGRTLLARHLKLLEAHGIRRVVLVVGYKQEMIRQEVRSVSPKTVVTFIVNEMYQRGSIGSLWAARHELTEDAIIMDADVLYHPDILSRLVTSRSPNALLMDETVAQQTEECMVVARAGRVVALTKRMPHEYDQIGEGVGFLKVSKGDAPALVRSLERCLDRGLVDMEYEDALIDFFADVTVGYEKIGGLPWMEIDFPEDVERAKREILPKIEKE